MIKYEPKPLDTSEIALPLGLENLMEDLSRNVHEVWAQGRIDDGWVYGPTRDDAQKTHPCLVPYEELPEFEKEYDRNTAKGTLKFILSRGYLINKK